MSGETRRPWTLQEDQAIRNIVKSLGTKRWSDVSQAMQQKFKLFSRSGKQCRQRWHNHLAPQVNKKPWANEEQQILFEAHKKFGNRWTQISKLIEGRTDNAIKNYFYSSIRRSLRRINKILGSKNSTVKMRNVKPAVLSTIFNMADRQQVTNSQDYKDLTSALIQFSRNRVKKQKSISFEEKTGLQNLIKKLMEFNDLYQKEKKTTNKNISVLSEFSKNNSEFSSEQKNQSLEQDEQEFDQQLQLQKQEIQNPESHASIPQHQHWQSSYPEISDQIGNGKRMNLQKSQYDWEQFEQRCQTIVNRYLVSMGSLKSMQNIPSQQFNQNISELSQSTCKSQVTPAKSERESNCSSREFKQIKQLRVSQRKKKNL